MNQEYEDQLLHLCQTLKSGDKSAKIEALDRLYKLNRWNRCKDRRSIESLVPLLSEPDPEIRNRTVSVLLSIQDPKAYLAVVPLLQDPDSEISRDAISYLGQSGLPQAGQLLLEQLNNQPTDQIRRELLARGVSQLLTPSLLSQVYDMCHHLSAEVRANAISILGDTEITTQSWNVFREALTDDSAEVRLRVLKALTNINPRDRDFILGLSLFPSDDFDVMAWLEELGPAVLPHLHESDPAMCLLAAQILVQMRYQPALPQLLALLAHESETVRDKVASYLGDWSVPENDSAFLPLLHDPVSDVRIQAAVALHKLGNPIGAESLLSWFNSLSADSDVNERLKIATVLKKISFPDEFTFWSKCLSDPHNSVQGIALEKISGCDHPEYRDRVLEYIAKLESPAQVDAIIHLWKSDARAIPLLFNWLTDSEPRIQQTAFAVLLNIILKLSDPDLIRSASRKLESYIEQALTQDATSEIFSTLIEWNSLRDWAKEHLTRAFMDRLTAIYQQGTPVTRRATAKVLCQMRSAHSPPFYGPLSLYHEMLRDKDEVIRYDAFRLFLNWHRWNWERISPAMWHELVQSLPESSADLHRDVILLLPGQDVPGLTLEPILRALEHPIQSVRSAAVEALGTLVQAKQEQRSGLEKWDLTLAVEPLLAMLQREITGLRIQVIEALGSIGDERAILPLEKALQSDLLSVGEAAQKALEDIKKQEVHDHESIQSNR